MYSKVPKSGKFHHVHILRHKQPLELWGRPKLVISVRKYSLWWLLFLKLLKTEHALWTTLLSALRYIMEVDVNCCWKLEIIKNYFHDFAFYKNMVFNYRQGKWGYFWFKSTSYPVIWNTVTKCRMEQRSWEIPPIFYSFKQNILYFFFLELGSHVTQTGFEQVRFKVLG